VTLTPLEKPLKNGEVTPMARRTRMAIPGYPYHVIQRGNNRSDIFWDDEDRETYLEKLKTYAEANECEIHAYVLMTNHVHLLVTPRQDDGLSRMMQQLGASYVRFINSKNERTGTLFEGRFRSSLIEADAYLMACYRYIELNPVRAKMVRLPRRYKWSSHGANAYGEANELIKPHPLFLTQRAGSYLKLFEAALPTETVDLIGLRLEQSRPTGGVRFTEAMEGGPKDGARVGRHGGDRRSATFRSKG
jgi:putative transposase